ncbi:hypothetical protein BGX29_011925 [Mortierella sp. GBA35]|nr:hypothetical protein BGX29_011925 [Mortierella sp. GBA35]
MDMDIDTKPVRTNPTTAPKTSSPATPTVLTRLCDTQSEHFYIYLTIEMESQPTGRHLRQHQLSILTFRKMLSSAVQDLFGSSMGGGINIDILGFWTDVSQDPYNRLSRQPPSSTTTTSNIPGSNEHLPTVTVNPTYATTTAASSVLRCHSLDINQLWNSLTLFNTLVDDAEARFEVRYVSSTLLGLQANSRQLKWPA